MRFLKKGDKKKPKSQSGSETKGHPDLKVISGSQISGRQPQQQPPPLNHKNRIRVISTASTPFSSQ